MAITKQAKPHFVHVSMRQSNAWRLRGHSDVEVLLQGTRDEICNHVAEQLRTALGNNGQFSEIRIIPVHPGNVYDLDGTS